MVQVSLNWQRFAIACLAQFSSPWNSRHETDFSPGSVLCQGWNSISSAIFPTSFKKKSHLQFCTSLSGPRFGTAGPAWVKHARFVPVLSSQLHFCGCCFSEEKYSLCYFHEFVKNQIIFSSSHLGSKSQLFASGHLVFKRLSSSRTLGLGRALNPPPAPVSSTKLSFKIFS